MRKSQPVFLALILAVLIMGCAPAPVVPNGNDASESAPAHDVFWDYIRVDRGTAPADFTVTDSEGRAFTLSEHRGERIVLVYLKAGCGKCTELLETYRDVAEDYADEYTFIFVEGTDNSVSSTNDAEKYLEENGLVFPNLYFDTGHSLTTSIPMNAYPVIVVFDEDGVVRGFNLAQNRRDYESVLEDIERSFQ